MKLKLFVSRAEYARSRGVDPRYIKLPGPSAALLAGNRLIHLWEYSEAVAPALHVNTEARKPSEVTNL